LSISNVSNQKIEKNRKEDFYCFIKMRVRLMLGLRSYQTTIHCTIKHLNNLIEQDYRHVTRRFAKSAGFQNLRHASRTIKGIETIQALYKQRLSIQRDSTFSTYNELQQLLANS
jgi:transposase-like protein